MKKLIIAALAVAAATTMYAQGTVKMYNDTAIVKYGDTCGDLAGSEVGNEITANLMYQGSIIASKAFNETKSGKKTGKLKGGIVATSLPAGVEVSDLTIQAINPADPLYLGESAAFSYTTGDPNPASGTPTIPDNLTYDAFTVEYIPEPTTIALGILGLSSLLVLRRRD